MDPQTAYYIVSTCSARRSRATRKISPYFETLHHAVRALGFLRERMPLGEQLHIEQGTSARDFDA